MTHFAFVMCLCHPSRVLFLHHWHVIEIKIPSIIRITLQLNITEKEKKKSPNGEFNMWQQKAPPLGEVEGETGDSASDCVLPKAGPEPNFRAGSLFGRQPQEAPAWEWGHETGKARPAVTRGSHHKLLTLWANGPSPTEDPWGPM